MARKHQLRDQHRIDVLEQALYRAEKAIGPVIVK